MTKAKKVEVVEGEVLEKKKARYLVVWRSGSDSRWWIRLAWSADGGNFYLTKEDAKRDASTIAGEAKIIKILLPE